MDTKLAEAIDYKEMFQNAKKRMSLDIKPIKKMLLYNYLNDGISNIIIDCRAKPLNALLSSQSLDSKYTIKDNSRLILIILDSDDFASSNQFINLREYMKSEDKITNGLFLIKENDYNEFIKSHVYYLKDKGVYQRKLPLCVVNDKLYMGSFINSKNKLNLGLLGIKTVISLMADDDKDFVQVFRDNYRNFKHEEVNHDEIDFTSIIEYIESKSASTPILIYCFFGQSASIAVCAAYIMISKKWSLEFSIGYMMKLSPQIKIPVWLFTQLQRITINKDTNK